jgi:SAM-dependent methyltransferase
LDPKDIVRRGYDQISYAYRADDEDESAAQYHAWLDELLPLLVRSDGGRPAVLELGCGCGIPVARRMAVSTTVTGVDISPVQIERARKLVPGATFLRADMSALRFELEQFDAVIAFYSIIHLPVEEQPALFQAIFGWLRPGGLLFATVGSKAWTGTEENWLDAGATMYWSHAGEDGYRTWFEQAGFEILSTRFIPEGSGGHTLMLAKKPR